MKERPVIFSGEMVRAILSGRKTQTRRVLTPQPLYEFREHGTGKKYGKFFWRDLSWIDGQERPFINCLYGQPGDRLWVRETITCGTNRAIYAADGKRVLKEASDGLPAEVVFERDIIPSIHMPRWASRITLEIVNVRVERLQNISETGAISEGVSAGGTHPDFWVGAFKDLWESIHKKKNRWEDNPWVWVIKFKLLERSV